MTLQMEHLGFAPDLVPYLEGWAYQRAVHSQVVSGERADTVLLLEHQAVFTAGKRTAAHERPLVTAAPAVGVNSVTTSTMDSPAVNIPVVDVDRGGKITWHGPGQIVGYPIVRLPQPLDVVAHVRRLEQAVMNVCTGLGLATVRVAGRSGVWVPADDRGPDRKVAAIGVRVSRGVTLHGFSVNCDCDLGWTQTIVPCGIADAGVTSLSVELGRQVPVRQVLPLIEQQLVAVLVATADGHEPK